MIYLFQFSFFHEILGMTIFGERINPNNHFSKKKYEVFSNVIDQVCGCEGHNIKPFSKTYWILFRIEKQERNWFYEKYTILGKNELNLVVEIQILIFAMIIQNSVIMWVGGTQIFDFVIVVWFVSS